MNGTCSRFPQAAGVQFELHPSSIAEPNHTVLEMLFVMKTQSVCIFGEDLSPILPHYRPDAAAANIDIVQIADDLQEARQNLVADASVDDVSYWTSRIAKKYHSDRLCTDHDRGAQVHKRFGAVRGDV